MAKATSREEILINEYRQFFKNKEVIKKNEEIASKLIKVFYENMSKILENNIKNIISDFNKEKAKKVLDVWTGKAVQRIELRKILRKYNNSCSFKDKEEEIINELEEKLCRFYDIILPYTCNLTDDIYSGITRPAPYFSGVCLKNFKGFSADNKDRDNTIKIKPITLIYGPNSFGKSSILQSLLLLAQTVAQKDEGKPLKLLDGKYVDLGLFKDVVNRNSKEKFFTIELTLPLQMDGATDGILNEISVEYKFEEIDGDPDISEISIYQKEIDINSNRKNNAEKVKTHEFCYHNKDEYNFYKNGKPATTNPVKKLSFFKMYVGRIKPEVSLNAAETTNRPFTFEQRIFNSVETAIKNILYISSFRNPPARIYINEKSKIKYVGKNGENTRIILDSDKNIRKKVSHWLNEIAGYTLPYAVDGETSSIKLDDTTTNIKKTNLTDLGSGVAQVLPIITQAFIIPDKMSKLKDLIPEDTKLKTERKEGNMILIEEPEIHLHPKAQTKLGSMFADAVENTNNTFIIETHSEHILLRLEKLVRDNKLSKDDVSVIYVHKDKNGSHCIPLILNDEGDIDNIEEMKNYGGFFEEGYNEVFG